MRKGTSPSRTADLMVLQGSLPFTNIVQDEFDYDLNRGRRALQNIRKDRLQSWTEEHTTDKDGMDMCLSVA